MGRIYLFTILVYITGTAAVDVTTKYGVIRGQTLELDTGYKLNTFLGIPFAKPPTGPLRWKGPEEPTSWSTPFIADRYGHMCPQSGVLINVTHPGYDDYDEDCLYLNVYAPHEPAPEGGYPVMVYIHGGGYQGSGSIQHNGHFLAAENVVMVVTNYRLGILGFMSTGDVTVTSNGGLLDQLQSLKFVKENIRAFGGNPDHVTIFGQSAGGSSVGLHLMSPRSTGYFHGAICQSGTEMTSWAYGSKSQRPENMTRSVAEQLGCDLPSNADMVECLRQINATTLIDTIPDLMDDGPELGFSPVVDGEGGFLPDDVDVLRTQGRYNKVPLLSGITTQDGSFSMLIEAPEAFYGGFNQSEYQQILRSSVELALVGVDPYRVEQAYQAFHHQYTDWPHVDDLERNRQNIVRFATDSYFGLGMDLQIKAHVRDGNPTYMYLFGYRSANVTEEDVPSWMGVTHVADIPFVFGRPMIKNNPAVGMETGMVVRVDYNDEDVAYSKYIIKLFTNFAKTGNPTPEPIPAPGQNAPTTWPRFDNTTLQYLLIDRQIKIGNHYRQRNFALFTDYLPWILTHNSS